MNKFLKLAIFILFLLMSCKSLPNKELQGFLGTWQRIDDLAEGDVVEIKALSASRAEAKLLTVSAFSKKFGYQIGDIKWQLRAKINTREYEIDNLVSQIEEHPDGRVEFLGKNYKKFKLVISGEKTLKLEALEPLAQTAVTGSTQEWHRVK